MGMTHEQILERIGQQVIVNRSGDLAMSVEHRRLIGQTCKLVKLTKAGLVLVEFEGKQLTVRPRQIDPAVSQVG